MALPRNFCDPVGMSELIRAIQADHHRHTQNNYHAFTTMVIFTFIVSRIANLSCDGSCPYVLLFFAAPYPLVPFPKTLCDLFNSLISKTIADQ